SRLAEAHARGRDHAALALAVAARQHRGEAVGLLGEAQMEGDDRAVAFASFASRHNTRPVRIGADGARDTAVGNADAPLARAFVGTQAVGPEAECRAQPQLEMVVVDPARGTAVPRAGADGDEHVA